METINMVFKKSFQVFIFSLVITAFSISSSNGEINDTSIIDNPKFNEFSQTVQSIKTYVSILPEGSFRNNKEVPNVKKALFNKYEELNRLYMDTLYNDAREKIIHDIRKKMDGCMTFKDFSNKIRRPDMNDWITDCNAQFNLIDLNRILVSLLDHRFLFPYPESVDTCSPGESVNDSVLIGTYNTQNLPDGPSDAIYSGCCEHIPNRTQKLADRIIASGYDVIALTEVFREEVQEELAGFLREEYPFYVKFVDPGAFTGLSDSGLMLFSRFPFLRLPDARFRGTLDEVIAYADHDGDGLWHRWGDVAVRGFLWPYCSDEDCLAAKGAAMVRVQNPNSCRIYNIVFTHLQAWDFPDTRTLQLALIADLIQTTVPSSALMEEELILLGDLNVNGDYDLTSDRLDRVEWENKFGMGSIAPFSRIGLAHDAWEYETQASAVPLDKRDRGLTYWYEPPKERLDYILRNNPIIGYQHCNQHMTIAYNLRHGANYDTPGMGQHGIDLSDHFGVNIDLNRWASYCSSADPRVITVADYHPQVSTANFDGEITYPGSMQWYRIDEAGTYSIAILEEGFDYRLYESRNMSVHFQPDGYRGETTSFQYVVPGGEYLPPTGGPPIILPDQTYDIEGTTHAIIQPPFYIRVFAVNDEGKPVREHTGEYTLLVHKHTGNTKEDAVILFPNLLGDQNEALTDFREKWFRIDPDMPTSGRAQELRFYLEPYDSHIYSIQLLSDAGGTLNSRAGGGSLQIDRRDVSDNGSTLYLVVQPLDEASSGSLSYYSYRIGWATNLSVVHTWHTNRMRIECVSQTSDDWPDAFGEDDDNVTLKMDLFLLPSSIGDPGTTLASLVSPVRLAHEFDSGQVELIDNLLNAVALLPDEVIALNLYEDDDDDHEYPSPDEIIAHEDTDVFESWIGSWGLWWELPTSLSGFESDFNPFQYNHRVLEEGWGEGVGSFGEYRIYYNYSHGTHGLSSE